jgi:hypothetical protein
MPAELFERVVAQVAPFRPQWVALNHFSEPLLDPEFLVRCRTLFAHRLPLALFTNATALAPSVSRALVDSGLLARVSINLPSVERGEWARLMGLSPWAFERTLANIRALAEIYRGDLRLAVNVRAGDPNGSVAAVAALFRDQPHVTIEPIVSNTMAGHIGGELVTAPVRHSAARLAGCTHARPASHAHVSTRGDVYICSLDYRQRTKCGNLAEATLIEILGGPVAASYRRQVYGLEEAAPDLICRDCSNARVA